MPAFRSLHKRCTARSRRQRQNHVLVDLDFFQVHQVGDVLFRVRPRYDTPPIVSAGVIAIAIAISAFVLSRRIRAIEVVT